MVTDKQAFALALMTWSLRNGLSQAEAAKRLGCSRSKICRAESACKLTLELVIKISTKDPEELWKEVTPWLDRR